MEEEIKNLLKENLEVSRESLKILKKIRSEKQISFFLKIIYWLIALILFFQFYNFLKPSIDKIHNLWQIIDKIEKSGM